MVLSIALFGPLTGWKEELEGSIYYIIWPTVSVKMIIELRCRVVRVGNQHWTKGMGGVTGYDLYELLEISAVEPAKYMG